MLGNTTPTADKAAELAPPRLLLHKANAPLGFAFAARTLDAGRETQGTEQITGSKCWEASGSDTPCLPPCAPHPPSPAVRPWLSLWLWRSRESAARFAGEGSLRTSVADRWLVLSCSISFRNSLQSYRKLCNSPLEVTSSMTSDRPRLLRYIWLSTHQPNQRACERLMGSKVTLYHRDIVMGNTLLIFIA